VDARQCGGCDRQDARLREQRRVRAERMPERVRNRARPPAVGDAEAERRGADPERQRVVFYARNDRREQDGRAGLGRAADRPARCLRQER